MSLLLLDAALGTELTRRGVDDLELLVAALLGIPLVAYGK